MPPSYGNRWAVATTRAALSEITTKLSWPGSRRNQYVTRYKLGCPAQLQRLVRPDRWLSDFDKLDIKPEVRALVLKDNAVKLLGLSTGVGAAS